MNSIQMAGTFFALTFGGVMADTYGRKRVFMICFGVFLIATIASVFVTSFKMLIICRFVVGGMLSATTSLKFLWGMEMTGIFEIYIHNHEISLIVYPVEGLVLIFSLILRKQLKSGKWYSSNFIDFPLFLHDFIDLEVVLVLLGLYQFSALFYKKLFPDEKNNIMMNLGNMWHFGYMITAVIAYLTAHWVSYLITLALIGVPLIFIYTTFFESSRWLIQQGNLEQVSYIHDILSLTRAYGW